MSLHPVIPAKAWSVSVALGTGKPGARNGTRGRLHWKCMGPKPAQKSFANSLLPPLPSHSGFTHSQGYLDPCSVVAFRGVDPPHSQISHIFSSYRTLSAWKEVQERTTILSHTVPGICF